MGRTACTEPQCLYKGAHTKKKHASFQCSMNVIMLCFASSRGTMSKANHSAIQKGLTRTAVCIYLEKCKTEEKCKQYIKRVYHFLQNLFDAVLQVRTSGWRTTFIIGAPRGSQFPGILLL